VPLRALRVNYTVLSTPPDRLAPLFDRQTAYLARVRCLDEVSPSLSDDETYALLQLIHYPARQSGLRAEESDAFRNVLANALKASALNTDTFAEHLMAMFQDQTESPVWRDYCIQHLGSIWAGLSEHRKGYARKLLWQATRDETGAIAGTALLALYHNAGQDIIDVQRVGDAAVEMAADPSVKPAVRLTALQVAAALDDKRIIDTARLLLAGEGDIHLKMSALATIGTQGDTSDIPALSQYAKSHDIRLRTAARVALKKLYVDEKTKQTKS